jgi:tetrapyrrole methylase family protein/MazG family protein
VQGIIVVGLGPGSPDLVTREAWNILSSTKQIYLRTKQHPVVDSLPTQLTFESFDSLYESLDHYEEVYHEIVDRLLGLALAEQEVVYAVPGDPTMGEATHTALCLKAQGMGVPIRTVHGVSFLEPCLGLIGVDGLDGISLLDALDLVHLHHPPLNPDLGALIGQVYSSSIASEVKLTLMNQYPDEYPVILLHEASTPEARVEKLCLFEIDRSKDIGALTTLYVPPTPEKSSFEAFQNTIAHLRAPDGCPWDREQTHASLRAHLLEETYEALLAIDQGDLAALSEELGDLLLQIVLHAQIAVEAGAFRMDEVIARINKKLIQRHPHVFGDLDVADVDTVLQNWENLKAAERGVDDEEGLMEGVPIILPALSQASELQQRATRVGFDWPSVEGVLEKILEELLEIKHAGRDQLASEIGDLLFAIVNYARWKDIDPESELRNANNRFRNRFKTMVALARKSGRVFRDLSLDEMEAYWEAAKSEAKG